DGAFAKDLFGVTESGTFEHGTSVLRLARDIDAADATQQARWRDIRRRLDNARITRPQPSRDDKVVAEWNALAITALAGYHSIFGALTGQGGHEGLDTLGAAVRAGELLLDTHIVDGRLRRVSRDGIVGAPAGVLADYGGVAAAFAQLHQATGEARWIEAA